MSMISNNIDLECSNISHTNICSSPSSFAGDPLISASSSSSSIYSDNSQQGFQPPLDNSQHCYCAPSLKDDSQCDVNFTAPRNRSRNSSKVATAYQHSEFKATFYNPFETKHRRRTSRSQFKILEAVFEDNPKPSAARRQSLAEELEMTPRGVQIWFQNRRAKAKQMLDEGRRPDRPRQPSGNASLGTNKGTVAAISQPLYTEWNIQDPLNVTKNDDDCDDDEGDNGDDCPHMTSLRSPLVCVTNNLSGSSSSNSSNSNRVFSSRGRSISSGITGIHPESRAQAPQAYYTATTTGYYNGATCLSSSSSPVDPGFELPATPTAALSPNIYTVASADQQINKPSATAVVYSAINDLYNNCDFIGGGNPFFPIAITPAYSYQEQAHISDWAQGQPALTEPLIWPSMPHHRHHYHHHHQDDPLNLVPWTTLDPHHNHYHQITVPLTTAIFPSQAHSSALHGVATTTAADNKDNFVDLAHVNAATLGGYSGTNHRPPSASFEPHLEPASWEQTTPW